MRLLKSVFGLLFVVLGVCFGALNRDPARIELGFRSIDGIPLGVTLLLAVLVGALLAGLVLTVGVIWPLRHRLRRGVVADAPSVPVVPVAHE
jgi:putative membrane protein